LLFRYIDSDAFNGSQALRSGQANIQIHHFIFCCSDTSAQMAFNGSQALRSGQADIQIHHFIFLLFRYIGSDGFHWLPGFEERAG
jgi:hypothetical protein